jgi:poly(A) polymerase
MAGILNKLFQRNGGRKAEVSKPDIISASVHQISHSQISRNALKVLHRLDDCGYSAYLVGGSVRDLMLGHRPKDFDVATNATPQEMRKIFRNSRIIGRRFQLVHVHFGREIIEVATFRGEGSDKQRKDRGKRRSSRLGMLMRDNIYGTIEDDAWRRDCTVNALYYNITDRSVVDYTKGAVDIQQRLIRIVGDPVTRYREDPVRMLRVIRFMAKLDFDAHPDTLDPIHRMANLMQQVSSARLFIEVIKLFYTGAGKKTFELLEQHGLFTELFPLTAACLSGDKREQVLSIIRHGLHNTDERHAREMPLSDGYLFAVLLWHPLQHDLRKYNRKSVNNKAVSLEQMHASMDATLSHQGQRISLTRRAAEMVRGIWLLQDRMQRRRVKDLRRLITNPHFKAAYDFLLLRAQAGEPVEELANWWEAFYTGSDEKRDKMVGQLATHPHHARRLHKPKPGSEPKPDTAVK